MLAAEGNVSVTEASAASGPASGAKAWSFCAAAVLLAILFSVINWQLITGHRVQIWDAWAFYTPAFSLVADHARAGRLLLWDPWLAAGTPDFADPQVGAASPIAILVGVIGGGTARSFRAYWLLIWFLGPLGLVLLARHLGSPPWAAFVVALGYAYCGFYTGHAEHTTVLYSFSFLPLLVWRFDVALASPSLRPAAEAGAMWGLSAVGGYPGIVILSGGMLFLWGIGRCFCPSKSQPSVEELRPTRRLSFVFLSLAIIVGVGLLVLAPTYVAFFGEGWGYTERAGALGRKVAIAASQNSLNPGAFATFASPYLTALKFPLLNPGLWPGSDVSIANIYTGVLPFILTLLAIWQRPQSAWRWWLVGVIFFALACAVGDRLPLRGWLYDYFPPTRYFTYSGMFRAYAIFSAAVLALLAGADIESAIHKNETDIWRRLFLLAGLASIAAVYVYVHVITHVKNLGSQLHRANWHVVTIWTGAVVICVIVRLLPRSRKWLPALFAILAIADASLTMRLSHTFMSDNGRTLNLLKLVDARHDKSLMVHELNREASMPAFFGGEHVNSGIPMRISTLFNDSTMKNRFHSDFAKHPVLRNMGIGDQRIWFAKEVVIATPSNSIYAALIRRSESLGAPVLVVHPSSQMYKVSNPAAGNAYPTEESAILRLNPAQKIPVQVIRYTPNHMSLRVSCPADGWLLVTDRWASGWHAVVNGRASEVFGGNFIFRAVRVQAGENEIQFDYRQKLYFLLLALSWSTLGTVLIAPGLKILRRRRGNPVTTSKPL